MLSWLDTILKPLIWAVSWIVIQFHKVFGAMFGDNSGWAWGLSIVFLTLVIRAALIPLFVKQIKSMRNMQVIQPEMQKLQAKYKKEIERYKLDPEKKRKLQQKQMEETRKLYKEYGANPFSSCLPILVQMPFWSALYRMLANVAGGHVLAPMTQHLVDSARHADIFGAPMALRFMDSSTKLHDLQATGSTVKIVTLSMTLVYAVSQFFVQRQMILKNTNTSVANPMVQQQKAMMYIFPVMMLFIGLNMPVGLLVYMLTTNFWTAGQQFYILRNSPTPGSQAYVEWEQRKKEKEARRAEKKLASGGEVSDAVPSDISSEAVGATAASGSSGPGGTVKQKPTTQRQQPSRQSKKKRKR